MNKNVKTFIYDWILKEWYRLGKPSIWCYTGKDKSTYFFKLWIKEGDKTK